jgi:hypothetical protein
MKNRGLPREEYPEETMKQSRCLKCRPFGILFVAGCCIGLSMLFSAQRVCGDPDWTLTGTLEHAAHRSYDYNTLKVSDRANIFRKGYGSYTLHCLGSGRDGAGESFSYHLRGIGSPIDLEGKTYFLGAGHVFDVRKALAMRGVSVSGSTISPPEYFFELQGRRFNLVRIDNGTLDLALFVPRAGQPELPTSGYRCGNSDDLSPGVPVLSWGMPLLEQYELSTGIVSALTAPQSLIESSFQEATAEDFFVTSMPTIFGCSGALVYAFRDGQPEIVGMLVAGYININRSIVYKINSILRDAGIHR